MYTDRLRSCSSSWMPVASRNEAMCSGIDQYHGFCSCTQVQERRVDWQLTGGTYIKPWSLSCQLAPIPLIPELLHITAYQMNAQHYGASLALPCKHCMCTSYGNNRQSASDCSQERQHTQCLATTLSSINSCAKLNTLQCSHFKCNNEYVHWKFTCWSCTQNNVQLQERLCERKTPKVVNNRAATQQCLEEHNMQTFVISVETCLTVALLCSRSTCSLSAPSQALFCYYARTRALCTLLLCFSQPPLSVSQTRRDTLCICQTAKQAGPNVLTK